MREHMRASFVVRVVKDPEGRISGVVERAATGAKEPFSDAAAIGAVILELLGRDSAPPGPDEATPGAASGRPTA